MKKYRGARALLNLPGHESTSAIVAEIEDTSRWREGRTREGKITGRSRYDIQPHIIFQISNCDRSIEFSFDLESPEICVNNIHKIDTMINCLFKFRVALMSEQDRYLNREKLIKALEAKEKKEAKKKNKE